LIHKTNFTCSAIYTQQMHETSSYVSTLHGCHHQGFFRVVKVALSKWSVVCTTVIHLQTH